MDRRQSRHDKGGAEKAAMTRIPNPRGPMGLKRPKEPEPRTKPKIKAKRKTKPAADKKHLTHIASLPCVICGYWPVEVHHCISDRYSQRKAPDSETIPLCYNHHRGPEGIHTSKERWEAEHGKDYSFLDKI